MGCRCDFGLCCRCCGFGGWGVHGRCLGSCALEIRALWAVVARSLSHWGCGVLLGRAFGGRRIGAGFT